MTSPEVGYLGAAALLHAAIRISTPVSMAAVGEAVLERAGVINVGLEGVMLAGAFSGFVVAWWSESFVAGAVCGAVVGALAGLVFAVLVAKAKANPIATGVALNLIAMGSTAWAMRTLFPAESVPLLPPLQRIKVPLLASIPFVGSTLFDQSPYFFALLGFATAAAFLVFRSKEGLKIRAAGDNPRALLFAGYNPENVRVRACVLCGVLAGLAGTQLSIDSASTFTEQATAGRGFVALAIVVIARKNPLVVPIAGLVYGIAEAYTLSLLASGSTAATSLTELLPALPFALTLIVYAIASLSSKLRSSPA